MQYLKVIKQPYILLKSNILFLGIITLLCSFQKDSNVISIDALHFSVDRYGNVFYVNKNNDIKKYGDEVLLYSPKKRINITHFEAWNSIRIFIYNREYQEYTILDKYLTEVNTTAFNINELGFVNFATVALDGNIWAIDNTDYSLKKINIQSNKTINTTNLNFIIDQQENEILFMKEYGNFLYVSTIHNGILVFDNLGTYKKKLPFNNISFLGFQKNELYFLDDKEEIHFNILTLETIKKPSNLIGKLLIIGGTKFNLR